MKTLIYILSFSILTFFCGGIIQAQRVGINTGFGVIQSKHLYSYSSSASYASCSINFNIMVQKSDIYSVRFSYGKWYYADEDDEVYSFYELSALKGLILEKRWFKIYGMAGIGYSHHHYWTDWPQGYKPYDINKFGLAYETGISFIPFSRFGLGVKFNGQLTTQNWSSYGIFLVFDFGMLRK